ncbi:MAG: hypothetical protein EGR83_04530 [Bacteroides cellulosilyticus]|nr:hypothetical protein [Bacteroides cellulosilyticus]
MLFYLDNLLLSRKYVSLYCVFHSIRFKVNKGWSTAVLLFFMPVRFLPLTYIHLFLRSYSFHRNLFPMCRKYGR